MPVDLEKILRPVDNPMPPFPAKHMKVASGEEMVIRQVTRDEIPSILPHVAPLVWVERDFYDVVAARVYAELLAYYAHRMQDEYVLVAQIDGELCAVVNGRMVNKDVGMSLHTLAMRRGLRIGAHAFAAKMEYHMDILGQKEVLIVAESPIGFRRWMIEYNLEKRFDIAHELGGVPSWALTKELFETARDTLVVGRRPVPDELLAKAQGGHPAAVGPADAARGPARGDALEVRPDRHRADAPALEAGREGVSMRDVYVIGIGITSFTRLEFPLSEIAAYPAMMALKDAGIARDRPPLRRQHGRRARQPPDGARERRRRHAEPDARGRRDHRERSGLGRLRGQDRATWPSRRACTTSVMVTGAERMREVNNLDATDFVATLTHPIAEYIYGVTLPSLAAMFTRLYMEKYGVTERHLAMVAVKNQNNGAQERVRAPPAGDHRSRASSTRPRR